MQYKDFTLFRNIKYECRIISTLSVSASLFATTFHFAVHFCRLRSKIEFVAVTFGMHMQCEQWVKTVSMVLVTFNMFFVTYVYVLKFHGLAMLIYCSIDSDTLVAIRRLIICYYLLRGTLSRTFLLIGIGLNHCSLFQSLYHITILLVGKQFEITPRSPGYAINCL